MSRITNIILRFALSTLMGSVLVASEAQNPDNVADTCNQDSEWIVRKLYELVTFGPDSTPDWTEVEALFAEDARISLRTSREKIKTFDRAGFIEDFATFAATDRIRKYGFSEEVIQLKAMEYGDIAQILVLYAVNIPGSDFLEQKGVDSFHLIRYKQVWKITSIINEAIFPGNSLPGVFEE